MNQKYHHEQPQCFQLILLSHPSMKYAQLKWICIGFDGFQFHTEQISGVLRFEIDVIKHVVNDSNLSLLVKVLLSLVIVDR